MELLKIIFETKKVNNMKNIYTFIFLSLFFLLSISSSAQKMQSSSWSVNQSLAAYSLDKNDGERQMTIDIDFETPFKEKPQIILSITQMDSDKEANVRVKVEAISISRDGFTLKVSTWADSKLFSISGYWLATTK
jgi:outer membrane usher protein FimD/PapC